MSFFSITLTMFLIMNSVGHINGFLNLVHSLNSRRRKIIVVREMILALLIMIFFYCIGELLFKALEINSQTVFLAGGVILFLIAIKMIFPNTSAPPAGPEEAEPFIFPLATPMIAGPSALTTIMLYARQETENFIVLAAIILAWLFSITVLLYAEQIMTMVGKRALLALERLMGLVLTMMAVEMLLKGIRSIILSGIQN